MKEQTDSPLTVVGTPRIVLTVSGDIELMIRTQVADGSRPLADFLAIADATNASLLDYVEVRADRSPLVGLLRRLVGPNIAMAYHLFRRRADLDVIITDGEQVGLPLALMMRVGGRRGVRHLMIAHRLSGLKKTIPIRLLGLAREVDVVFVYSSRQQLCAEDLFSRPDNTVQFIDFMVDTEFFSPGHVHEGAAPDRPLVCAAGREFRDYPTLIEAVRGLEVDVVIASASPWSRREDNAHEVALPPNVTVTALTQAELRDHFGRSAAVVVPLLPTDFQAGITTILEAMAMGAPVVCTRTVGQNDVVEHGVNGLYVPPGDVRALRESISKIVAEPDIGEALGRRGRKLAESRADVRVYAAAIAASVETLMGTIDVDGDRP